MKCLGVGRTDVVMDSADMEQPNSYTEAASKFVCHFCRSGLTVTPAFHPVPVSGSLEASALIISQQK
jgi:hypothetical protein